MKINALYLHLSKFICAIKKIDKHKVIFNDLLSHIKCPFVLFLQKAKIKKGKNGSRNMMD